MRALALGLLALLVVVVGTSAWVRLAQSGLSCEGGPACYATAAARAAAERSTSVAVARTLHRFAASAAGLAIVAMAFVGWRQTGRGVRTAIVGLGALAIGLATLGQFTPSTLPAVTLGNLLGGMAMVGLAAWLALAPRQRLGSAATRKLRGWTLATLALVALQIVAGGMIGARFAAFACDGFPLCNGQVWPQGAGLEAFDPMRELALQSGASTHADPARQALVLAHRALALPTLLLLAWVGLSATRSGATAPGGALLVLAVVQLALGLMQALAGPTLVVATAHNLVAAGVVIALATLLARAQPA